MKSFQACSHEKFSKGVTAIFSQASFYLFFSNFLLFRSLSLSSLPKTDQEQDMQTKLNFHVAPKVNWKNGSPRDLPLKVQSVDYNNFSFEKTNRERHDTMLFRIYRIQNLDHAPTQKSERHSKENVYRPNCSLQSVSLKNV